MAIFAAPFDIHWPPEIQKVFPFISKVQKIVKTEQENVAFLAVLKGPLKDLYSRSWGGRDVVSICSHMTHTRIKTRGFTCSLSCPQPV